MWTASAPSPLSATIVTNRLSKWCCAEGKRTALFDATANEILTQRHRWARIAEFLQSPAELKAYLRKHCSTEDIDTSNVVMDWAWQDEWTGLPYDVQGTMLPGPRTACINLGFVRDWTTCAYP